MSTSSKKAATPVSVPHIVTETTFKKRECIHIIQTSEDRERCGCGRRPSDHQYVPAGTSVRAAAVDSWTIQTGTKEYPTDAYGVIAFQGGPHPHKAQFVRLAFDTKPEDVLRLLEERWKLGRPKLVISILGSMENFDLQPKLAKVFGQGLVKAVRTTGAWIISSGLGSGVDKHIAAAFAASSSARARRKSVLIGVAPWGMLQNRDDFVFKKATTTPSESQLPVAGATEGAVVSYHSRGQHNPRSRYAALSEAFTHFLLVDDGTTHRYGADQILRRRLEEYIRQQVLAEATQKHIPVVGVLLKGGVSSLRMVLDFVTSIPALPVVVVDGSGGAADLLGMTDRRNENGPRPLAQKTKTQIEGRIRQELCVKTLQLANVIFAMLMIAARRKKKISVFRLGETNQDFDNALLTGLLKAHLRMPFSDRLALTLTWNRPDIASEYVFPSASTFDLGVLEANMMEALIHDRVEFVQLLLANGVSMEKFLTKERLLRLYNRAGKTGTLSAAMEEIHEDVHRAGYQYTLPHIGALIRSLMGGTYDASHYRQGKVSRHPFNDLLIWAVLTKRHNMALCMWRNGHGPMPKALAAIRLNEALSIEAADEPDADEVCADFDRYAGDFRQLSLQLLSRCYRKDDDKTLQLLTRELSSWGNETCLSLAVRARHKEFLAHPACQLLLSDLWQGGLHMRNRMNRMVLLAILIPPALFLLDYKTKEELMLQARRGEEQKNTKKGAPSSPPAGTPKKIGSFSAMGRAAGAMSLKCVEKVTEFYAAPITKFWVWTLAYLAFLVIYTWFILLKTPAKLEAWQEMYILAYAGAYLCDLFREILMSEPKRLRMKVVAFLKRRWHLSVLIAIVVLLLTPVGRFVPGTLSISDVRLLYACNLVLWYVRLFEIMTVHKTFGPYIIMFGKTLYSFITLSFIFAVLIASYGLTVQGILKTDYETSSWKSLRDILYQPYFMMFGEVFPAYVDRCGDEGIDCVPGYWAKPILQAAYLLVMDALLLNLLIATFTNIFTEVKTKSLTIWKFYRYYHIMEYGHKPLLPPPVSIISHIWALIKYIVCRFCCRRDQRVFDQALKLVLNKEQTRMIWDFEAEAMDELNSLKDVELMNSPAERIARSDDKSEFVNMKLDDVMAKNTSCREFTHSMEIRFRTLYHNTRQVLKIPGTGHD